MRPSFVRLRRKPRRGGLFIDGPLIYSLFFGGAAAVTLNHSVSLLAAPPKNKANRMARGSINRPPLRGFGEAALLDRGKAWHQRWHSGFQEIPGCPAQELMGKDERGLDALQDLPDFSAATAFAKRLGVR